MRVAAALFDDVISPRLDGCTGLLVADDRDAPERTREVDLRGTTQQMRLQSVLDSGAEVLLCGGLRRCDRYFLTQSGVRIVAGFHGAAREVLCAWCRGEAVPDSDVCIGWGGRGRCRRKGGN